MEKTILNFHFDYLHPSLIITLFSENFTTFSTGFNHCNFSFPSRSRSFPRMEASDSLPEFREWIFFIPFPFPNIGNGLFQFPSRSRTLKSHSRSPLTYTFGGKNSEWSQTRKKPHNFWYPAKHQLQQQHRQLLSRHPHLPEPNGSSVKSTSALWAGYKREQKIGFRAQFFEVQLFQT